jgi:hypothetical protein
MQVNWSVLAADLPEKKFSNVLHLISEHAHFERLDQDLRFSLQPVKRINCLPDLSFL